MTTLLTYFLNECRRTASLWWAYRLSALSSIVVHLVVFPVLILLFQNVAVQHGASYDASQQLDSLLGFLTWYLCMKVMVAIPQMVEDEATLGTLESIILTPLPLPTTIALRTIVYSLRYGMETLLLGGVLSLLLGLPLPLSASGGLVIFLTLAGTCGIGLALAGLALVYKSVGSVVSVIGNLALLLSGALVPLDSLGSLFVLLKYGFPMTLGITILRRTAYSTLQLLTSDIAGLALQTMVLLFVGGFVFFVGMQKAKRMGALAAH